ncbi:MAG: hypothetical protein ABTQ31_14015 [Rhizobiaceae bacterium]
MIETASLSTRKTGLAARLAAIALACLALTVLTGAAFAGWLNHGAGIFLAMAETGLSWCF